MKYVGNAFSLQMLNIGIDEISSLHFMKISKEDFDKDLKDAKSIVGHQDLANILGVPMNRESIKLKQGDTLLVAQVTGGRLPEGATSLPDDVKLEYFYVSIKPNGSEYVKFLKEEKEKKREELNKETRSEKQEQLYHELCDLNKSYLHFIEFITTYGMEQNEYIS